MQKTQSPKPQGEQIFNTLRDRICLLDYPPGTVLHEATLAREFGVSRTPVRAVLQKLAHGGLVAPKDGVGTIVTDPNARELADIYHMRMKTAEMIGLMTPRPLGPDFVDTIAGLRDQAATLTDAFHIKTYWQINHHLHFAIADIIGNTALRDIWDLLYFQAARFWYQYAATQPAAVTDALLAELENVLRAAQEGDALALGYVERNSIAYGLARLIG